MKSVEVLMRVSMASLFLGGCAHAEPGSVGKSVDTLTASVPNVFVPAIIETPTPFYTIVPQETEVSGRFVLDEVKLADIAGAYLADTMQKAIEVARAINWFPNSLDEYPSDMCGPLSGQILIDAGIIKPLTRDELKNIFWLAKASRDQDTLSQVFPKDQFDWKFVSSPFGTYDFASDPLKPGDWIYLDADKGGTFEHMLTVTRVERDAKGNIVAAYSVNNVYVGKNAEGERQYNIVETKLYDIRTGESYEFGYPNGKFNSSTGSTFVRVRMKDVSYSGDTESKVIR